MPSKLELTRSFIPVPAANNAEQIKQQLGQHWLPTIYAHRIRRLRTRSYRFDNSSRSRQVEIQHTLLGVELKVGRRRLLCPDLATARYLSVFARAGCNDVAIPYDITKISLLADELESSWYRMLLLADEASGDKSEAFRTRLRGLLFAKIRMEIAAAGSGTRIPEFLQETRQRHGKF
jgi:hypothetical protein